MKVMVYRWGTNFTQQQIDPLLKKYQNLSIQKFENENFFDVLELAGNHKQWTGLYNSNHYDVIFCIHSSFVLDNIILPDNVEINNVYSTSNNNIIDPIYGHVSQFDLNEHFFYTDNITFNTISLFKKFKSITINYTDINFYGFTVNNGIKNNIARETNE